MPGKSALTPATIVTMAIVLAFAVPAGAQTTIGGNGQLAESSPSIKPPTKPAGTFNPKEFKLDQKPTLPSSSTGGDKPPSKKVPAAPK